jgi:hypothetical protein
MELPMVLELDARKAEQRPSVLMVPANDLRALGTI